MKTHVSLLRKSRCDYTDILVSSDIVISIGYTTPGVEALLLGKRSIYYEELGCGGQAFRHLPDFIAGNADELACLFDKALRDYANYADVNSKGIDGLDPYRDGKALKRMLRVLVN